MTQCLESLVYGAVRTISLESLVQAFIITDLLLETGKSKLNFLNSGAARRHMLNRWPAGHIAKHCFHLDNCRNMFHSSFFIFHSSLFI